MGSAQQYLDLYRQYAQLLCAHSAPPLNAPRQQAFETLQRMGFPTQRVEQYRYTNIEQVFAPDYGLNLGRIPIPVNPYEVFGCDVPNLSTWLYFIVNDEFYVQAQPKNALPQGVVVCSLGRAANEHPQLVERCYNHLAQPQADAVDALNTMLVQDGLFVYIGRGVKLDRPLQIVNILRGDVDMMVNRRVLVVMEEDAEACLLMCDHAIDQRRFVATQVSEVFVGKNARLELYELEETHELNTRIANQYVHQEANSHATLCSITLHNGLTRNSTQVMLQGQGAEACLYGCAIADRQEHIDNHTLITHAVPGCTSSELYKYVLDEQATGAFAGRILVRPGAQGTASRMTNANLVASRQARVYTQPMLEIYADDVKCSHGSTVGQISDAALFYMRQRGIPEAEARMLLKTAFLAEVLNSVRMDALRTRLSLLVEKRFRGELNKCKDCKFCR